MTPEDWKYIYHVNMEKCHDFPDEIPILDNQRIIVIGDVHGDMDITIKSLRDVAKVINNKLEWIGGTTIIVQLGDQIDSCRPNGIPCKLKKTLEDEAMDIKILVFFTKLHEQAQKEGGAVYSLIGNHELMNVNGDMTYVSYENIKEFENLKLQDKEIKIQMDKIAYPIDIMKNRQLIFSPGNPIANFLACTRKLILKIGSNLFVHAGIVEKYALKYKITDINRIIKSYLMNTLKTTKDKKSYREITDNSGPLWNRQFGSPVHGKVDCDYLTRGLKVYKVGKIFVGHTPQFLHDKGINSVCDNQIWLTDYGASKAFDTFSERNENRKIQVLEIINDNINILN
jgi:hypothetical protein